MAMKKLWARIKGLFQSNPKKLKAVEIWRTPGSHPNVIGMIGVGNRALVALARIGYGSGYQSALYTIDRGGGTSHIQTSSHETVGHEMFEHGGAVYLPVEHGGNKILRYKDGKVSQAGQMPGGWTLAGCSYKGEPIMACTAKYPSTVPPTLHNADSGKQIGGLPKAGIIWSMYVHNGKLCAINCYGESIVYRDGKASKCDGKVGASFGGSEWWGGGNRSGRGAEDGRIYKDGKPVVTTDSQSGEIAVVTKRGRCFIGLINPDRLYEIKKGKAFLVCEWPRENDPDHRGGWAFGFAVAELSDGTILVGRNHKSGGAIYRMQE
jgi:hypothetical protein